MVEFFPASVAWQVRMGMLVSVSAGEMALCIRTVTPGCPRAREEHAERVVVSYIDCLSLIYSSLPMSLLQEAEMGLKGQEERNSPNARDSFLKLNCYLIRAKTR